jgi:hypothetical protein
VIASHDRQENFSRTCWITFHEPGTCSRLSVTSSPSLRIAPPQQGQADGAGYTTRSRGRCSGNGRRAGLRRVKLLTSTLVSDIAASAATSLAAALSSRSASCSSS